jgi:hypothetical protein
VLSLKEIKEKYGLNPNDIGHDNRGWTVIDDVLLVITKDTSKWEGLGGLDHAFTKEHYSNFLWVSGDTLDPKILYYHYHALDMKQEEKKELWLKNQEKGRKKWK